MSLLAIEYLEILEQAAADLNDSPEVYDNPFALSDERHGIYENSYRIAQLRRLRSYRRNAARKRIAA